MRIMTIHSDFIKITPIKKALKDADEKIDNLEMTDCIVIFTSIEKKDQTNQNLINQFYKEIEKISDLLNCKKIMIYPLVHLTSTPSTPIFAKQMFEKLENILSINKYEVKKAPFGWYKSYELKCKGHPLSELSREINNENKKNLNEICKEEENESLKQEDENQYQYMIIDETGKINEISDYNFSKNQNFKKLIDYEIKKARKYENEPEHIKLMKKHELVDYESGSDSGNLRWYPKGKIMKKAIENYIENQYIDYGAMEVETPIMFDFSHPTLKKYLNRFPARHYTLKSDDKNYFLRFAACFGQFLIKHDMTISYKNLPLKMFEMTRYSFRREQSGEVTGLKRLRAFTMPDMHTLCKDISSAKQEFINQYDKSKEILIDFDIFDKVEVAFRVQKDFFEENKQWYLDLAKKTKKPIFLEIFKKRYAYFITKFEFNFIDASNKASALSTVQIDVENAETYDINYIDEDGQKKKPYILHASLPGAIERVIYAILEKQAMIIKQGKKAIFPFFISPIQIRLIPISKNQNQYCIDICNKLNNLFFRCDMDDREESLGKKIRNAQKEWIPYICVVGEKEEKEQKLNVTIRKKDEKEDLTIKELEKVLNEDMKNYPKIKLALSKLLSKRPKIYTD